MLERIENAGPGAKARRLVFDDGIEPRLTSAAAVKELGLQAGVAVSRDSVDAALCDIEYALAKDRALRLLNYREHSSAELRRKLGDNGYPTSVASAVVDRFIEVELVDDSRFALAWTRSRVAAGYGPRRIKQELSQRGIEPELIEAVLAEVIEPAEEIRLARQALGHRTASDRAGRDRLVRRLITRGFSLSVALQALEADDDSEPV